MFSFPRGWQFYSAPGAVLDLLCLVVALQHARAGRLPPEVLHSAKINVALWLWIVSALALAHGVQSAWETHLLLKPAVMGAFFTSISHAIQARVMSINVPVTPCLHRRVTTIWGFRAAWSTVLAVSGALANVGTPVPLGWAYQGSLAALLLLAIFTAMSLPYDSTEVIAATPGLSPELQRHIDRCMAAAEDTKDILHVVDILLGRFSRWVLFGSVQEVLTTAQTRRITVDDLPALDGCGVDAGNALHTLWAEWRKECTRVWGRTRQSQCAQHREGDMSSAVRDSTSGAFQGLPRDMSLGRLIESGLRRARQAITDAAGTARETWEQLVATAIAAQPASEEDIAARLTQPLLSQSESEAGTHGRNSQDAPVRFGATLDLHESTHSPLPARPPATSPQDAPATAPGRLSLELRAQEARASEVVQRRSMSSGPPVQAETAGESLGVWTAEGRRGSEWYCLERTASSIFRGGDSGASRGEDRGGGEAETSPRGGAERDTRGPSLLRVLMGAARGELVALSAIKVGNDLLGFVGAFLLHQIVSCLETSRSPKHRGLGDVPPAEVDSSPLKVGLTYAALLAATAAAQAFISTRLVYRTGLLQVQAKWALAMAVFKKTLLVGEVDLRPAQSMPDTLMRQDADRVAALSGAVPEIVSASLQILLGAYFLYLQLGWSLAAGLAPVLLIVPVGRLLTVLVQRRSVSMLAARERRLGALKTVLSNIKQLMMLGWEGLAAVRVMEPRRTEMKELRARKLLRGCGVFVLTVSSVLLSTVTFITFVVSGGRLTATTVFTSLALFSILIHALDALPWAAAAASEAHVAMGRLGSYLALPETMAAWEDGESRRTSDPYPLRGPLGALEGSTEGRSAEGMSLGSLGAEETPCIVLEEASFMWAGRQSLVSEGAEEAGAEFKEGLSQPLSVVGSAPDSLALGPQQAEASRGVTRVSLAIPQGALAVVHGPTASGKTSLLLAIRGEMRLTSGRAIVRGRVAYVAADPWLFGGSVRDNIVCRRPWDQQRYMAALEACALDRDLELLPKGDLTDIRDRGGVLSGGQKRRVAMARALYQDPDVVLIDGILGLLDAQLAAWLFEKAILPLRARGKTVVLVAHSLHPRELADVVIEMLEGRAARVLRKAGASSVAGSSPHMSSMGYSAHDMMASPTELGYLQQGDSVHWTLASGEGASPTHKMTAEEGREEPSDLECLRPRKYERLREVFVPPLDLNAPASIASGSPQGTMPLAVTTSASQLALHDSSDDSSDDSTGEEASERTRGSGPGGVAGGASVASTGRGEKVAPKKQRSVVYSVSGVTRAEDGTVFSKTRSSAFEDKRRSSLDKRRSSSGTAGFPQRKSVGGKSALPAESNAGLQASTSDSKQAAQEVEEQGPSPKAGDDSLYETPGHLSAISEREAEAEAVRTPSARTGGRSSDLSGTPLHTPGSATPAGACGSLLAKERVERGEGRRSGRGDAVRESRDSSSEGLSSPGDVFGMHDGVFSGHLREGQGAHEVETQSPAVLFYVWAVGPLLAVCALACLAAMQASRNGIDLWLAAWATDPDSLPRHTWLRGLALLLFVSILLAFLRSLALSSAGLSAARSVHASLLGALLAAPAAFFDVADPRALLSRFSADVPVIDDLLPQHMGLLLAGGAELLGAAAVLFCKQPILLAGLPPLVVAFSFISRFFRFARREIRRLEDVLAPPLHALTLDIASGGADLRALGMQEAFLKDGLRLAESSVRAALASVASGAWLAVRLHMLVAAVVTVIAVVAVLQHSKFIPESSHEAQEEASLLGLSLVYALTLTGTLRTTLTSSAEVESDLLAAGRAQRLVERMSGTAEAGARLGLEHQVRQVLSRGAKESVADVVGKPLATGGDGPGFLPVCGAQLWRSVCRLVSWPSRLLGRATGVIRSLREDDGHAQGSSRGSNRSPGWVRRAGQPGSGGSSQHQARVIPDASALLHPSRDASHIVFHHVWLRYHPGQPHALSDVSFSVPRGHRVAIIGRTGSGKSSLFALLLRLYRPSEGRILLGGEDLSTMSPAALREAVGSVSHAPVLLSGSVRDNLDPEAKFDDHELVEVLRATQLWDPLVHAALGAGVSLGTPATNQLLLRSTTTPRPRHAPYSGWGLSMRHDAALPTSAFVLNPGVYGRSEQDRKAIKQVLDASLEPVLLSQGQRQQLGLARVLLRRPVIVLLDESTTSMDPVTAATMLIMCKRLLASSTVLHVTHRLGAVMESNGVLLMERGRVVECGAPMMLARDPQSNISRLLEASKSFNNGVLEY